MGTPIIAATYALGMAVLLLYGLNLLWLAAVLVRRREGMPPPGAVDASGSAGGDQTPSVTVQLPVYNEALVIERLIDACASLDYPADLLQIQVLDDSTDDTTELARRRIEFWRSKGRDLELIRRPGRTGYKAGALGYGLERARGELVAIFDADFLPAPDFLRRTVGAFGDADVGMVQVRWGHLNERSSLLTRIQAFGLDTHFAVEQRARDLSGCFINFNGTAGVWRKECIEDAGGWMADTLTEDLDLSYRAQLKGWRFRFLPGVEVPAELPVDMNGFRGQQFRWTKGAVQTALKLLPALWRSNRSGRVKMQGTMHLTAHLVFPFILVVAALHAPLAYVDNVGRGPGDLFFAAMSIGLAGFSGFFIAQVLAQQSLYSDWRDRLKILPLFLAGSMGLSVNNSKAVLEALVGYATPFVRTPKYSSVGAVSGRWWASGYALVRLSAIVWIELAMTLYCTFGAVYAVMTQRWAMIPFQLLFVTGFGLVTVYNFKHFLQGRMRS